MFWLSVAGGIFLIWLVLVFLFTPGINYHLADRTSIHARDFMYTLQSTCQAALHHGNKVTVFTNGVAFYPAMLQAISQATRSINMELYIFQPGRIADQFVAELSAKARQGITVTIVVDALGSLSLWGRPVRRLRKAGCRIESYQRLQWYSLARRSSDHLRWHPNPSLRRTRRTPRYCRSRTSSWRYRPGSTSARCPS